MKSSFSRLQILHAIRLLTDGSDRPHREPLHDHPKYPALRGEHPPMRIEIQLPFHRNDNVIAA